MKILYGARMVRFGLLRAVCSLARCVTKWDKDCDRKLHRLMCYIWSTRHYRQVGWVGDDADSIEAFLYADADFAGDPATMRSTSGVHVDAAGPFTKFPVTGVTKIQNSS